MSVRAQFLDAGLSLSGWIISLYDFGEYGETRTFVKNPKRHDRMPPTHAFITTFDPKLASSDGFLSRLADLSGRLGCRIGFASRLPLFPATALFLGFPLLFHFALSFRERIRVSCHSATSLSLIADLRR